MSEVHGEAELATRLRTALSSRHEGAGVAVISPSGARSASFGAELEADYELGSLSKGITGLLYADAVARAEIDASTTLGDLLPVDGTRVCDVTLAALSTHSSGLPRLPRSSGSVRRTWAWWRSGANPYGDDLTDLVAQARSSRVGRHRPLYSNFGFELLGHALARAASTTYADLLQQRIAVPLGLSTLYAPQTPSDRRPGMPGALPATAPALDPVAHFSGGRNPVTIGAAWITLNHDGRQVTWHNGATGGFSSWLGIDREAGTGVAILSATAADVTGHGFTMLADLGRSSA